MREITVDIVGELPFQQYESLYSRLVKETGEVNATLLVSPSVYSHFRMKAGAAQETVKISRYNSQGVVINWMVLEDKALDGYKVVIMEEKP